MRISVVIPALNEESNIANCLKSLQDQTRPLDEVIVVDNESEDDTADIARSLGATVLSFPRPDIHYGNVGLVRQKGVETAVGDVIISTDADFTHPVDYVQKVEKRFQANGDLACLGGPVFISNPDPWTALSFNVSNFHRDYWAGWGIPLFWGGNTSFRKDSFMRVGGYKGTGGHGPVEEWVVSFRLTRAGPVVWDSEVYSFTRLAEHHRVYLYALPLSVAPLGAMAAASALAGVI